MLPMLLRMLSMALQCWNTAVLLLLSMHLWKMLLLLLPLQL